MAFQGLLAAIRGLDNQFKSGLNDRMAGLSDVLDTQYKVGDVRGGE